MSDNTTNDQQLTKQCGKCRKIKERSAFSKHTGRKDGLQSNCKECVAEYYAAYHSAHRDKIAASCASYREAHREEISARDAAYYTEHRKEKLAYQASYNAAHRVEKAAYVAAWRVGHPGYNAARHIARREEDAKKHAAWLKANPDKCRATKNRRRARKLEVGGMHTAKDIQRQGDIQRWLCWWCGKDCKDKYHVDHLFPLARGGHNDPSNLVISCPRCNRSKHAKTPDEFAGRLL